MPNLPGLYTDQKMWSDKPVIDNIYPVGTILTAKEKPELSLIIVSYSKRIYYCDVLGVPAHKQMVYFEKELLAPLPDSVRLFSPVTGRLDGIHRI